VDQNGGAGVPPPVTPSADASSSTRGRSVTYSGGGMAQPSVLAMAAAEAAEGAVPEADAGVPVEQRRVDPSEQIGRNDLCWCGSGKKYKKCHGA